MTGKPKIFGREGDWLFVNSAHSVGRERLDAKIPENDGRGAVRVESVANECRLPVEGLLVGNVALRRYIEDFGYTKRRANQIIDDFTFVNGWRGLPATVTSSVDAALEDHRRQAKDAHRDALAKARKRRWTDVTGGS